MTIWLSAINIATAHLGIFGEDLYRVVGEVLVVDQRHPPEVFQAPEMLEAVLHDAAVRPVYPRHLQLSVSPHRETVVVPQLDNHPKLEVGSSPNYSYLSPCWPGDSSPTPQHPLRRCPVYANLLKYKGVKSWYKSNWIPFPSLCLHHICWTQHQTSQKYIGQRLWENNFKNRKSTIFEDTWRGRCGWDSALCAWQACLDSISENSFHL